MRENVKQFVELLAKEFDLPSPVIDVGSLRTEGQEEYADLRPFFRSNGYTGFDMRSGPGVDGLATVHRLPFAGGAVGTVLLLDTLEHVLDPLGALHEVARVLRPGGVAVISSHMNFPIHAHPSDYWRFTPMAFDYLLRALPQRAIFTQGDAENPHTVLGIGILAVAEDGAAASFRAAIRGVQARWPDESYGGPLSVWEHVLLDAGQRIDERSLPLLEQGRRIAQSFVCQQDGLSRIDVKMANAVGPNLRHVSFRLSEDTPGGRELSAYRMLAWHVIDGGWLSVPVPVQPASAGQRYVLTIESPDGAPDQAVTARASAAAAHADGQLTIDGEAVAGSLCFQAYCRAAPGAALDPWAPFEAERGQAVFDERPPVTPASDLGQRLLALEEQAWERARYVANVHAASIDGLRETMRAQHAGAAEQQRRVLEQAAQSAFREQKALEASVEAARYARDAAHHAEEAARHAEEGAHRAGEAAQQAGAAAQAAGDTAALIRSADGNMLFRIWRRLFGPGGRP